MVMAAFALTSSLGLLMAGAAWQKVVAKPNALRWAVRLSGLMMVSASGWALGHGLWRQIAAYCFGRRRPRPAALRSTATPLPSLQ